MYEALVTFLVVFSIICICGFAIFVCGYLAGEKDIRLKFVKEVFKRSGLKTVEEIEEAVRELSHHKDEQDRLIKDFIEIMNERKKNGW